MSQTRHEMLAGWVAAIPWCFFFEHVLIEDVFHVFWRLNYVPRISIQPILTFTVCRGMSMFATPRALIFQKFRAGNCRTKFRTTFGIMRLTIFQWKPAVLTEFTEWVSHFGRLGLGWSSSFFGDSIMIIFCLCLSCGFFIPNVLEQDSHFLVIIHNLCCCKIRIPERRQRKRRKLWHIQATVFTQRWLFSRRHVMYDLSSS